MKSQPKQSLKLNPRQWGLATKLIVAMTLLSLTSVLLLVMTVSQASSRELEQQVQERLMSRATLEGAHIATLMAEQVEVVRAAVATDPALLAALAASNAAYSGDAEAIETYLLELDATWRAAPEAGNALINETLNNPLSDRLRLFTQNFPAHAETFVTDRYGAEIAGSGRTSDYYQADEGWWQAAWNDGSGAIDFGVPELDASAGIIAIDISLPIFAPDNQEILGIVKSVYDIAAVVEDTGAFSLGESGRALLIDVEGHYIAGQANLEFGEPVPKNLLLDGDIFTGVGYTLDAISETGEAVVVGYAPVVLADYVNTGGGGLDWIVRIEQNRREAFAPIEQLQNTALMFALIAGVIAVGVALVIGRHLTNPLIHLAQVATQLGAGETQARAMVSNQDEIGQLADSFNTMAERLEARNSELIELNQTLEARVQERTRALRTATAKAKEAARVKGEFLSTMSHELRTPLNAIIGFSDMLLMGMSGALNAKQEHKVQRLQENGKRLLELVNDTLDLTRIEAGRIELNPQPFAPTAMAERLTEQMGVLAQQNNLTFDTDIDPDLPMTLMGDEKRIEQVVVNLLANAFKFTDEGSVMLDIRANLVNKTWIIAVTDTGIGIPPHAKELIFEEFRQLDGSTRRVFKGSGLGLAITKQLVRVMDGQIAVESEVNVGSTFSVTLPLIVPEAVDEAEVDYMGA